MTEFVGMKEFADCIGWSVKYARDQVRKGNCPKYYRFGREIRFRKPDLLEWVESKAVEQKK